MTINSRIKVLDCTLRDGGYCNNWTFGQENICKIISGLSDAKIDIIECGFITNRENYNRERTKFTDFNQIDKIIPLKMGEKKLVVMINYGEYSETDIPNSRDTNVSGIRIAFHKHDMVNAIQFCYKLKQKGYDVFLQPMVTMNYSEEDFISMIKISNELEPYAFYLVDSFGTMNEIELLKYYNIAKKYVNSNIKIGFHSHNNLQSAFSNALLFVNEKDNHELIVDCSVYGMGRGAGNLNSELFLNWLNDRKLSNYEIKPILKIMDDVIQRFYEEKPWGYSLSNYISARHNVHPNYASYLSERGTLTYNEMDEIISLISEEKSCEFDKAYIKSLYMKFMTKNTVSGMEVYKIIKTTHNKEILIIAPGKSALDQSKQILDFIDKNKPIVIGVNHNYILRDCDYIFVSNIRRFNQLKTELLNKTIATSNIGAKNVLAEIEYDKLINKEENVGDNAGLMALKFVKDILGSNRVYVAGLDGYVYDFRENYESEDIFYNATKEYFDSINIGMKKVINEYSRDMEIKFITMSNLIK